jgi:hypothetical protein
MVCHFFEMVACRQGMDESLAKQLVEMGAPLDAGDGKGNTALHFALERDNMKVGSHVEHHWLVVTLSCQWAVLQRQGSSRSCLGRSAPLHVKQLLLLLLMMMMMLTVCSNNVDGHSCNLLCCALCAADGQDPVGCWRQYEPLQQGAKLRPAMCGVLLWLVSVLLWSAAAGGGGACGIYSSCMTNVFTWCRFCPSPACFWWFSHAFISKGMRF